MLEVKATCFFKNRRRMTMKNFNLVKFAGVGALVLCFTFLAAVSFAQSGNTNGTNANRTETRTVERDNDTDWGWLGLLGLAGLAGLLPKKRTVEIQSNQTTNRT
jgi:MYXO-CTERM domain-containing protein